VLLELHHEVRGVVLSSGIQRQRSNLITVPTEGELDVFIRFLFFALRTGSVFPHTSLFPTQVTHKFETNLSVFRVPW